MSKAVRFYALLTLCMPVSALAQNPPVPPQPLSVEGTVAHVYKSINGTELRLHVFNPPSHSSSMSRSAILFFFGGGWTQGSVEQFVPQSKHLATRGTVAIVPDYRVFGRHKTSPFDAMADAQSAIRWVRSHAKELGIDPNRIVAGGGSAGGHIALGAAVLGDVDGTGISARPNALVLFNPVVDTSTRTERFGDRWKEGSPFHHIGRNLPPTVIFHGKSDTTVPYADVDRFCLEARKLGNRCELLGYEGATHGFFNPAVNGGHWYRDTLLEADRFLTEIGYLPKPVPARIAKCGLTAAAPDGGRATNNPIRKTVSGHRG